MGYRINMYGEINRNESGQNYSDSISKQFPRYKHQNALNENFVDILLSAFLYFHGIIGFVCLFRMPEINLAFFKRKENHFTWGVRPTTQ